MDTIYRERFQQAIEDGIAAAPKLQKSEIDALRRVGVECAEFSQHFSGEPSCPLTQAGLYPSDGALLPEWKWDFVSAFDASLQSVRAAGELGYSARIQVVDR